MEKLYCGGQFRFDPRDHDFLEKAGEDYRALLLGNAHHLLNRSQTVRISDSLSYIGPFYYETETMADADIVQVEMRMVEACTLACFLLDDGLCPGTISEMIYAATLHKNILIVYVRHESETESSLRSPCWYPILQCQLLCPGKVQVMACCNYAQAVEIIQEKILLLTKS